MIIYGRIQGSPPSSIPTAASRRRGNAWPGVQLGEAVLIFRVKSSFSGGQLKAADLEVQMRHGVINVDQRQPFSSQSLAGC